MKRTGNILWGIALVAVGVIFALNALDITNIDIFFNGWWTLFIIIPCFIGLFNEREKTGNIIGLLIGIVLLLACQNLLSFELIWKLAVPVIIVAIGIRLIFKGTIGSKYREASRNILNKMSENGTPIKVYCATFSGQDIDYGYEVFSGAELTAVFGGIDYNLTNAEFNSDAVINITSIFGGVDLKLPDNVNVKVSSTSIFGGVSNKKRKNRDDNSVTVYVNATCIFGGADIK